MLLERDGELKVENAKSEDWKNEIRMLNLIDYVKKDCFDWNEVKRDKLKDEDNLRNLSYALTFTMKLGAVLLLGTEEIL